MRLVGLLSVLSLAAFISCSLTSVKDKSTKVDSTEIESPEKHKAADSLHESATAEAQTKAGEGSDDYAEDADARSPAPMELEEGLAGGSAESSSGLADHARRAGGPARLDGPPPPGMPSSAARYRPSGAPALQASSSDDNVQFGYYLKFLKDNASLGIPKLDVEQRIILQIIDSEGRPIPNVGVTIEADGKKVWQGKTYASGQLLFFPQAYGLDPDKTFRAIAKYRGATGSTSITASAEQLAVIKLNTKRELPKKVGLDVAFILDTTGSMGDEISRLKDTLYEIHRQVTNLPVAADIRFAMVLYRDRGDEYVTNYFDFTGDVEQFQMELDKVGADGGGDYPESLLAGLAEALHKLHWREDAIRIAFTVADAPPQFYADEGAISNDKLAKEAAERAIKLYMVGASGLNIVGEYVFRQLAQFTFARFLFLHYGEQGESDAIGADPGRVSHHTGANYQVSNLDALIVRIIAEELSYLTPVSWDNYTPENVDKAGSEIEDKVAEIVEQLLVQIKNAGGPQPMRIAVAPVTVEDERLKPMAEFLADAISEKLTASDGVELIDRNNLEKIIQEHKLQLSDLSDPANAVRMGQLTGANLLLSSKLHTLGSNNILYLKAISVSTSRVLAMARIRW